MKTPLLFGDSEKAVRVLLCTLAGWTPADGDAPPPGKPTTCGIGVPSKWNADQWGTHVQIAQDGTQTFSHRLIERPLIRVTVWAKTTSEAKQIAHRAEALLCAHRGGGGISSITPAAGMFPARSTEPDAQLASFAVRVTARSTPLT